MFNALPSAQRSDRVNPGPTPSAPCLPAAQLAKVLRNYARVMTCPASVHWRAESFRATDGQPMTRRRALALNAVLERCLLPVIPGELLIGVGNIGRRIQADEIPADVIKADQEYLKEKIGARHFGVHSDHHAPDYAKLIRIGFGGLKAEVRAALPHQDDTGRLFLESMLIALDGASTHLRRWSRHLTAVAPEHPAYADRLRVQAERLARLAEEPPAGFADALQLVLLYHYLMQLDDRYAMAFGRMDQYLYPAYCADRAAGRITDDEVQDHFDHLFAKITVDGDVQNIALGGVRPEDGSDATNPLSYMILEACRRIGQPGGNCTARIHRNTPPAFLEKCAEVIRTGIGYPAVFNDEIEIPALVRQGYALEDARNYCFVGCIEVFMQGKQAPWADAAINPPRCLILALHNGVDPMTGEQAGPATGESFADFESFYAAFQHQCAEDVRRHIESLNALQREFADRAMEFTSPLMSALVADCIGRGRDLNDGGAVYPGNNGFGCMGVATIADSLAALRKMVFQERRFTFDQLKSLLAANFESSEKERQILQRGAPHYGNDLAEVDELAVRYTRDYAAHFEPWRNPQGGRYWALLGSNIWNIAGGKRVGATPDGRRAGTPLSDAASAYFGRDVGGPTALIRSVAKIPYAEFAGGNVINIKLHPSTLAGTAGLKSLAALIRTCFDLGGSELQFNTTDRTMLEEAMKTPTHYEDLVVRVSGFSAHFVWLDPAVQTDILARTEHRL